MIETIRRLLKAAADDSATDAAHLSQVIDSARDDLMIANARVAELEGAHGDVLLYGTDKEAEAHEASLRSAELEVRRLSAAIPRLEERLAEARQEELNTSVQATVNEAIAARDEGEQILKDLGEPFGQVVRALARLREIDRKIDVASRVLRDHSGFTAQKSIDLAAELVSPNTRIRPNNPKLYDAVVLPVIGTGAPSWGRVGFNLPFERSRIGAGAPEFPRATVTDAEGQRLGASKWIRQESESMP